MQKKAVRWLAAILACAAVAFIGTTVVLGDEAEQAAPAAATAITVGDVAYDLGDHDSALEYIGNYADLLGSDEQFAEHLDTALGTVRETIPAYATALALLPALIAIILALITKEVYSSLFIGILCGGLI